MQADGSHSLKSLASLGGRESTASSTFPKHRRAVHCTAAKGSATMACRRTRASLLLSVHSNCFCCYQCCCYCDWYCSGDHYSHCYCQCCCYCDLSLCLFLVLSRNVSASSCLEAGTQVVYVWHEDSVFQMGYIQETPIFLHHKAVCIVVEPTCLPNKSCQAVAGLSKSCDSAR